MKLLLTILAFFVSSFSSGQINIKYVFRDGCSDTLFSSNYYLFEPDNPALSSKLYISEGENITIDSTGLYMFSTKFNRKENLVIFSTNKFYERGTNYKDTIFLPKLLKLQVGVRDDAVYCLCYNKANGKVKDYYPNGKLRMEGIFADGHPVSNIKHYNINGKLILKRIYKSGHLFKIRSYRKSDYSDFY